MNNHSTVPEKPLLTRRNKIQCTTCEPWIFTHPTWGLWARGFGKTFIRLFATANPARGSRRPWATQTTKPTNGAGVLSLRGRAQFPLHDARRVAVPVSYPCPLLHLGRLHLLLHHSSPQPGVGGPRAGCPGPFPTPSRVGDVILECHVRDVR